MHDYWNGTVLRTHTGARAAEPLIIRFNWRLAISPLPSTPYTPVLLELARARVERLHSHNVNAVK